MFLPSSAILSINFVLRCFHISCHTKCVLLPDTNSNVPNHALIFFFLGMIQMYSLPYQHYLFLICESYYFLLNYVTVSCTSLPCMFTLIIKL